VFSETKNQADGAGLVKISLLYQEYIKTNQIEKLSGNGLYPDKAWRCGHFAKTFDPLRHAKS
jgi:hypothetical protein